MMERKLASVQTILSIAPIAGADKIVVVKVLGWECVALKEEFTVGANCVYFELDSILPIADWNAHLRKGSDINKPLRVKTIRLRGQLSQGLALPMTLLPEGTYEVGQDVTELVGVKKYEPYVPAHLAGTVKGNFPVFLHKTDEIRLQSAPEALDEAIGMGLILVGTLKMDGTSFTAYHRGEDFGVCSRNLDLKETEDNAHWKIARKLKLEEILRGEPRNLAVQGELVGPGIQSNRLGLTEPELHLFNLFDIDAGKHLGYEELREFCKKHNLNIVKMVGHNDFGSGGTTTVARMLEVASELNYDNGTPAEGIVWRPIQEVYSHALKGRMSFKTISNRYLEKYKE
jgi:RNA ligase (TIGR02306 family)